MVFDLVICRTEQMGWTNSTGNRFFWNRALEQRIACQTMTWMLGVREDLEEWKLDTFVYFDVTFWCYSKV